MRNSRLFCSFVPLKFIAIWFSLKGIPTTGHMVLVCRCLDMQFVVPLRGRYSLLSLLHKLGGFSQSLPYCRINWEPDWLVAVFGSYGALLVPTDLARTEQRELRNVHFLTRSPSEKQLLLLIKIIYFRFACGACVCMLD